MIDGRHELVQKMARSFASEWLRPNDPDAATPTLVDTLSTTMMAFYAATSDAISRRNAVMTAPQWSWPHPWTTTTDKNKCDICGGDPWGIHRFQTP